MEGIRNWLKAHPDLWEFILFNLLSNCATIINFGLCGFLSFLVATVVAQTVNFFVQKTLVFKSNIVFGNAVPKYIVLAAGLVVLSAALPAYSQTALRAFGVPGVLAPTLANVVNIVVQVVISFPVMKFWIMPEG